MSKARDTREQGVKLLQTQLPFDHSPDSSCCPSPALLKKANYASGKHLHFRKKRTLLILVAPATIPIARDSTCYKFDGGEGKKK